MRGKMEEGLIKWQNMDNIDATWEAVEDIKL